MRRTFTIVSILILLLGLGACSGGGQTSARPPLPLAPAIDAAPPAPPSGLSACNEGRRVKLAWDKSAMHPAPVGYRIHRTARGQTIALTHSLVVEERYVDAAPFEGPATYAVTAVDHNGNESAAAWLVHDFIAAETALPDAR